MGVGPIPWTAIDAYATRNNITGDAFEDLEFFITVMDDVWLTHQHEQAEKAKLAAKAGKK